MVDQSDDIIVVLRTNLKRIIGLYQNLKEECRNLQQKNQELTVQLSSLSSENNELKQKNNNTELTKAFIDASGSNHDAKIKINRIVREIDKCIALLNK